MDDELESMNAIARILAELDPEVADRIIRWAADRYGSGIYLAGDDLEGLDAASRASDALPGRESPAPSGDASRASGEARKLQPTAPGDEQQGRETDGRAQPPARKSSDRPSFLDTQYRMSVAKNLIEKQGDEDES